MRLIACAVGALSLMCALTAQAADYTFTLTGPDSQAAFTLSSGDAQGPLKTSDGSIYFNFAAIPGTYNGPGVQNDSASPPVTVGDVQFYEQNSGGGIEVNDSRNGFGLFSLLGEQLYAISSDNTFSFVTGTHTFTSDYFYGDTSGPETLDIEEVSSAPEPSTWALMMLGIGGIGAMLGYRKRVLVDHKAKLAAIG